MVLHQTPPYADTMESTGQYQRSKIQGGRLLIFNIIEKKNLLGELKSYDKREEL